MKTLGFISHSSTSEILMCVHTPGIPWLSLVSSQRVHSNELLGCPRLLVHEGLSQQESELSLAGLLQGSHSSCLSKGLASLILAERLMGKGLGKPAHFTTLVKGKRGMRLLRAQASLGRQLAGHSKHPDNWFAGRGVGGWGVGWNTNSA